MSLTYHFATHSLRFFIPIFTHKLRIISNKNIGYDGLITFWSTRVTRVSNYHVTFKILGNKIIISKWGKKLFQSEAASTTFYFKVEQALFQSGAKLVSNWGNYFKKEQNLFQSGHLLQSGAKCYFKASQLFQSGAIISKWSMTGISFFKESIKN